jgi:hypothetical protein
MGATQSTLSQARKLSKYTPVGYVDASNVAYQLVGNQVQPAKPDFNALCHLPGVAPFLYVTSAAGAKLAARSAIESTAELVIVSVCDAKTCADINRLVNKHASITHHAFVVANDDYNISPFDFVMTFYVHARNLAVVLQDQNKSVVVHCVMGMNRSCTTIVLAQILLGRKDVKNVVAYLKQVNKGCRLEVLENQAFVDNLVLFGEFAMLYGPSRDTTLKSLATRFASFCRAKASIPIYY